MGTDPDWRPLTEVPFRFLLISLRRKQIHCHWFAFGDGRKDGRAKG
jgi:hypothetical protein